MRVQAARRRPRQGAMKSPLDSLWNTVVVGLVLTAVLWFVVRALLGA